MKSFWLKSLVLTGALVLPSHALVGLGVHLAPAFGPEVKKSSGPIMPEGSTNENRIQLMTGGVSGLQGFGVKLWLDFIPVVDVEATWNIQFGQYDMAFAVDTSILGTGQYDTTVLAPKNSIPFVDNKPAYVRSSGDIAVLYPFFKIPLVKFSAGGGVSYIVSSPVLNNKFTREALEKAEDDPNSNFDPDNADMDDIKRVITKAVKDKDNYETGIGFFVQAGAKVKPPIIPLALYGDVKYGFGGPSVSGVSGGQGLTLEFGGAIAF
jgi:hypothetical protein